MPREVKADDIHDDYYVLADDPEFGGVPQFATTEPSCRKVSKETLGILSSMLCFGLVSGVLGMVLQGARVNPRFDDRAIIEIASFAAVGALIGLFLGTRDVIANTERQTVSRIQGEINNAAAPALALRDPQALPPAPPSREGNPSPDL